MLYNGTKIVQIRGAVASEGQDMSSLALVVPTGDSFHSLNVILLTESHKGSIPRREH